MAGGTLLWPRSMNGVTRPHLIVAQKKTRSILSYLEGVLVFQVPPAHLTIGDAKVTSKPVYICSFKVE